MNHSANNKYITDPEAQQMYLRKWRENHPNISLEQVLYIESKQKNLDLIQAERGWIKFDWQASRQPTNQRVRKFQKRYGFNDLN